MFVKAIGTLLLLGFFYVQLGTSLECYTCSLPTTCNATSLSTVTCNADAANATTLHLSTIYKDNLTSAASVNYDCFFHNLTSVNNNITYKGCIYRAIEPCSLSFKDEFNTLKREACTKCSGNLCNLSGTFSSSMMTMFASILVISVYKVLKM